MTSTTEPKETATKTAKMSRESTMWDEAEKGFLTDAERIAKNMDVEGKGHLSRQQAVALGAQYQSLKDDNKQIKNQLYGLAILCVLLFIGTVAGTVMAVKNSKDTIVDMKTGVMKVNDGAGGVDIVTVKAQGTTFKTVASIEVEEDIFDSETNETSTGTYTSYCVSAEDVASMWVANEQGSDASRIQPVTIGPASWKKDRIVMGSMIFTANEECSNAVRRKRRMLLQENNNDIEQNENKKDDMPSFDPILIHRALKQRVDILTGRLLQPTPTELADWEEREEERERDREFEDPHLYFMLSASGYYMMSESERRLNSCSSSPLSVFKDQSLKEHILF
ncbi:hypothetical protein FRACYDRAFT_254564 [Fragilariopsis cylindrus CCMP1102]|uniref:Uncharacterized protein n=1 Tax=Fragilariopsis cylindrus CCMP1102 TaxID=635003 RepID=A0A1E7EKF4_9STRA|nr:hypothetical protein FRACYDRAFT_254564 [Fragilariopsis cylindrus CCMP1102]|eukprot:OEU06411.1 hypothetical protein FRACYDRAFT_254564 [Fragilariopsis cylindrus CCMP1102]